MLVMCGFQFQGQVNGFTVCNGLLSLIFFLFAQQCSMGFEEKSDSPLWFQHWRDRHSVCFNSVGKSSVVLCKAYFQSFLCASMHFLDSFFGHRHVVNKAAECYVFMTNSKMQFRCINQSLSHMPMIFY